MNDSVAGRKQYCESQKLVALPRHAHARAYFRYQNTRIPDVPPDLLASLYFIFSYFFQATREGLLYFKKPR